jgi:hypothetical protein
MTDQSAEPYQRQERGDVINLNDTDDENETVRVPSESEHSEDDLLLHRPPRPSRYQARTKVRAWCFTAFTPDGEEDPREPRWDPSKMNYLVFQLERCATTNKLHWQGFVTFKNGLRLKQAQEALNIGNAHMEASIDTAASIKYCKKTDTRVKEPIEYGHLKSQGHRTDLDTVIELVKADASRKRIAEVCPREYIKFHKGIEALRSARVEPPSIQRKCVLLLGQTGVGKTLFANETYGRNLYNVADLSTPWFCGYDGQEVALFDECGEGMMGYNKLKQLTDVYGCWVPVKGGTVAWMAKIVIMTSNAPLETWYPKAHQVHIDALHRRIKTFNIPDDFEALYDYLELPRSRLEELRTMMDPSRALVIPATPIID